MAKVRIPKASILDVFRKGTFLILAEEGLPRLADGEVIELETGAVAVVEQVINPGYGRLGVQVRFTEDDGKDELVA